MRRPFLDGFGAVLLLAATLFATPARAGDPPADDARSRAAALRRTLPAPKEAYAFEGDLKTGDFLVGTVKLAAEPATLDEKHVWLVTEEVRRAVGESRSAWEATYYMAPDLSLLRGEALSRSGAVETTWAFKRRDDGIETVMLSGDEQSTTKVPAPKDVTMGVVPLIFLLQAASSKQTDYEVPGFDPRPTPVAKGGPEPRAEETGRTDARLEVLGTGTLPAPGGKTTNTWSARCTFSRGASFELHLDRKTKKLLARVAPQPQHTWVAKGSGGVRADWFDRVEEPSKSPQDALTKFGRGYHLPRKDLLEAAFHWPAMLDHEVKAGSYPEGTPVDRVKEDWVQEFVSRSLHRPIAECDELVFGLVATAEEIKNADGTVTLKAHPTFGGGESHSYHCGKVEDGWKIFSID